jgi:hypothetical protein
MPRANGLTSLSGDGRSARRDSMMRVACESAALLDPALSNDPNDFLYDKLGIPQPR